MVITENAEDVVGDSYDEDDEVPIKINKKRKANNSFDDEEEDEIAEEHKTKGKNQIESDSDSGIEENQNVSKLTNKSNEEESKSSDDEICNLNNSSLKGKKKYCFDDDSDSSENENDSSVKDTSLKSIEQDKIYKRTEKRETTNKKDKKKALEELVQRKKYKTRGEEKKEEFEANSTEHLFTNKDLFCANDSSSSDSEDNKSAEEEVEQIKIQKQSRKKKEKKEKIKKPTKASIRETQSEQQRLCRERKVNIPYHAPEATSLNTFLSRVPKMKAKSKEVEEINLVDPEDKQQSKYKSIFKEKPRLSSQMMEFTDQESSHDNESNEVKKGNKFLDSFMQRFAKQTPTVKPQLKEEKTVAVPNPGLAHQLLKKQLQEQIKEERRKSAIEVEKQAKLYNAEEISDDEALNDEHIDAVDAESSDSSDDDGNDADVDEEEDEEISKWNAEDERRQIEVQLEEDMNIDDEKSDKKDEINEDPVTSLPVPTHTTTDTQWSNSSSVLQAGQGNACNPCTVVIGSTPFTKLLKSGLLDSSSKSQMDTHIKDEASCMDMPIEDTQDLYRDEEPAKNNEEETCSAENFQFQLDEDTQFVPLLDSQGNFQEHKDSRKSISKSLFDAKLPIDETQSSLSQVLGFCSGSFADTNVAGKASPSPSESKNTFEDAFGFASGTDNVMNFCSGKLSDFKTQQQNNDDAQDETSEANLNERCDVKNENENVEEIDFVMESGPTAIDLTDEKRREINAQEKISSEATSTIVKNDIADLDGNCADGNKNDVIEIDENVKDHENESNEVDDETKDRENDEDESERESGNDSDKGSGIESCEERVGDESDEEGVEDEVNLRENEESNQNMPLELQEWTEFLSGKKKVKRLNKRAFYENEAELSGSDINSDDEEYGSEYDEYEIDSDVEDGLPEGEKLRRQVNKIHQRKLLDQDKREVRILQELYLEDGELGGGAVRKRNFRWRNIDDDNTTEENKRMSDDENDDPIMTMSIDQRLQRIEKEKFIQESQSVENLLALDENSQLILDKIQTDKTVKANQTVSRSKCPPIRRSGSLLGKASKLSAQGGGGIKQQNTQKSSRGFVFQSADDIKTPKTKKATSDDKKSSSSQPARKKQRIERKNSLPAASSIFHLL